MTDEVISHVRVPSLLTQLADHFITPAASRGWLSGEYVRFGEYARRAQLLYETCALLGFAFREKMSGFVELFAEPGREAAVLAGLKESASAQAAAVGGEPRHFYALFFRLEVESLMLKWRESGKSRCSGWSEFPRVVKRKLRRPEFSPRLVNAAGKGIAFGSYCPELMEKLAASVPDPETWNISRAGDSYALPSPPKPKPLPARQEEALALIQAYVEEVRPDLLARLGMWPEAEGDFRLRLRALGSRAADGNT
jgi:hypothetical protein